MISTHHGVLYASRRSGGPVGVFTLLLAAAISFSVGSARADLLFYGGDFDPTNTNPYQPPSAVTNGVMTTVLQANVYQNFVVPVGQTWSISGLFSNNAVRGGFQGATWSIRSGVSEGNGGALVAGGAVSILDGSLTITPTGRQLYSSYDEKTFTALGLNVLLQPGTYWMSVTPVGTSHEYSYNTNTYGLNSVGTTLPKMQFWDLPTPPNASGAAKFVNTVTQMNSPGLFSDGVLGTVVASTTPVPEPAGLTAFAIAIVACTVRVCRRSRVKQRKC